jgi:hypothetical protein
MSSRRLPALVLVLGASALTLAVAGCSPGSATTAAGGTPVPAESAGSTAGDCLLGANGADIEVGIGGPSASCSQWPAGDGRFRNDAADMRPD